MKLVALSLAFLTLGGSFEVEKNGWLDSTVLPLLLFEQLKSFSVGMVPQKWPVLHLRQAHAASSEAPQLPKVPQVFNAGPDGILLAYGST